MGAPHAGIQKRRACATRPVCLRGNRIVFPPGWHLLAALNYREIMRRRFTEWRELVCLQTSL
jgi:hypothetical protein